MKPTIQRWLAASAVVLTAVALWYLIRAEPDAPPRAPGKSAAGTRQMSPPRPADTAANAANADTAANAATATTAVTAADPWPEFRTPEFNARIGERATAWLESRGRDAAGLIAVWDLTHDKALLNEAAEKFPNDPRVCLAMIESTGPGKAVTLAWIEKLIAAEPKDPDGHTINPEGHLLKVWVLETTGDHAGALAALHEVSCEESPRESHLHARAITLRAAASECGLPEREAALLPLRFYRETPLDRTSLESVEHIVMQEMDTAKAAGDKFLYASMTLMGPRAFRASPLNSPRTFEEDILVNQLESTLLSRYPEEMRSSHYAREKEAEVMARSEELSRAQTLAQKVARDLPSASDAVAIEYGHRFVKEGEVAANQWFTEQQQQPVK